MTPALLERDEVRRERRPCNGPGRGITLAQLLSSAHEELTDRGVADCPVCSGEMESTLLAAECRDCGSRLS